MKKLLLRIVGMILAITMTMSNTVNTRAASATRYIKEVKLCYAATYAEAQKLMGNEYTVVKNSITENSYTDRNHPNGKQNVWVGYTTTDDPTEAVTDIAAMNMNGEFDENGYDAIVANFRDMVQGEVDALQGMIDEYRVNYNKEENAGETGKAHAAYEFLTYYLDDDCLDKGGKPMSLADVFLKEELCTDDHITDILIQGNTQIIMNMEKILAYAQNTGDVTWIKILQETTYKTIYGKYEEIDNNHNTRNALKQKIAQDYADEIGLLHEKWEALYEGLKAHEESGLDENSTQEEVNEVAETEDERLAAMTFDTIAVALKKIPYNGGTLFDYFYVTKEEMFENKEDYYPILAALSVGEKYSLRNLDLSTLILSGLSDEVDWDNVDSQVKELKDNPVKVSTVDVCLSDDEDSIYILNYQVGKDAGSVDEYTMDNESNCDVEQEYISTSETESVSIFFGVNRDFYRGGVAMTRDAADKIAVNGFLPDSSDEDSIDDWGKLIGLSVGATVAFGGAVAALTLARRFLGEVNSIQARIADLFSFGGKIDFNKILESVTGTGSRAYIEAAAKASDTARYINFRASEYIRPGNMEALGFTQGSFNGLVKEKGIINIEATKKNLSELQKATTAGKTEREQILKDLEVARNKNLYSNIVAIGLTCVFIALLAWDIAEIVKRNKAIDAQEEAEANKTYTYDRDIPKLMVWAKDTEEEDDDGNVETVTDYLFYEVVTTVEKETDEGDLMKDRKKNNGTNADIYAYTQKQWVALYTSTDWAAGDPILASSLMAQLGEKIPADRNGMVHLLGDVQTKALNLQDASILYLVEKDGNKGLRFYYQSEPQMEKGYMSAFSENTLTISLASCGLLLAGAAVCVWLRKRKRETV